MEPVSAKWSQEETQKECRQLCVLLVLTRCLAKGSVALIADTDVLGAQAFATLVVVRAAELLCGVHFGAKDFFRCIVRIGQSLFGLRFKLGLILLGSRWITVDRGDQGEGNEQIEFHSYSYVY